MKSKRIQCFDSSTGEKSGFELIYSCKDGFDHMVSLIEEDGDAVKIEDYSIDSIEELLRKFEEAKDYFRLAHDKHRKMEQYLLAYINDSEVNELFNKVGRIY